MPYPITNNLIPGLPQKPYRYGVSAYEGVVAHATASFAPDENEVSFMSRNWQNAFVHFFVDWDSIRQTADLNYMAWGAGPKANPRFVHVELCQTKDPQLFQESYKRYIWLLAWILAKKNLGVTDGKTLASHSWVTHNLGGTTHEDPIDYLQSHGVTWAQLVADVKAEYTNIVTPIKVEAPKPEVKTIDSKTAEAIKILQAAGVISSPEYWLDNAIPGKSVKGENVAALIQKFSIIVKGVVK